MKPWQLAKMMRVLEVRANLVLIFFSITKSLPFLSAGVGVCWMCLILMVAFQNGNHFFFSLQNHYRFLVLEWSQLGVLDTHDCIPKRHPFVMETIGFPL
jgi:hypothetical protein